MPTKTKRTRAPAMTKASAQFEWEDDDTLVRQLASEINDLIEEREDPRGYCGPSVACEACLFEVADTLTVLADDEAHLDALAAEAHKRLDKWLAVFRHQSGQAQP